MNIKTRWRCILGWRIGDLVAVTKETFVIGKVGEYRFPQLVQAGTEGKITKIGCFGDSHLLAIDFSKGLTIYGIHENNVEYIGI